MNVGDFRHSVRIQDLARTKVQGEGFSTSPADVTDSEWWCSIESATAGKMERLAGPGSLATATHILHGRYHEGITTRCRLVLGSRVFAVQGVVNVNEADEITRVIAEEIVQ